MKLVFKEQPFCQGATLPGLWAQHHGQSALPKPPTQGATCSCVTLVINIRLATVRSIYSRVRLDLRKIEFGRVLTSVTPSWSHWVSVAYRQQSFIIAAMKTAKGTMREGKGFFEAPLKNHPQKVSSALCPYWTKLKAFSGPHPQRIWKTQTVAI